MPAFPVDAQRQTSFQKLINIQKTNLGITQIYIKKPSFKNTDRKSHNNSQQIYMINDKGWVIVQYNKQYIMIHNHAKFIISKKQHFKGFILPPSISTNQTLEGLWLGLGPQ